MNYSENEFMFLNNNGSSYYKEFIKRVLKENYSDVEKYLSTIIPSKEMYFTKEQIDVIIKDLSISVSYTLKEVPNGIQSYLESSNVEIYYNIIADRITYGVIFVLSKKILSTLLHIIDYHYIFHYIKGSIILPNIKELIKILLELKEKDSIDKEIDSDNELCRIIRSFLNSLIINIDYETAAKVLSENIDIIKQKTELVESEIKKSNMCVPDFVYDLLLPKSEDKEYIEQVSKKVHNFHMELSTTHSDKGLNSLFRKFCLLNETSDIKIDETIKMIRNVRGFDERNIYIDGITQEELEIIRRILQGAPINNISQYFTDKPYIIENFKYIKRFYNIKTDDILIEDNIFIIKRNLKEVYRFEFFNPLMITENESVFNLFKEQSEKIKKIFFDNPSDSVLSQAVLISNPNSNILIEDRRRKIEPKTMMEKIEYRKKIIEILKNKFYRNNEIRENIAKIEQDNLYELKYIKEFFKSSNFHVKDEKRALYLSLELQRVFELANKERNMFINQNKEVKK